MSLPEVAPVREGEILDGKYRVERVLGAGGMGVVVAATHVHLSTRVALKFLLPGALGNQTIVDRFAREARAAVQIRSEHVARVIDVGTLPTGSPYMVMEFLEGSDLAELLQRRGPLAPAQAVGYVLQAGEAIAEAHALGIVHRDLKPANLFLAAQPGRDPIVKVLDFGISKTHDASPSSRTATTAILGSPHYMAPEQMMSSRDVDPRADVWALGIILYELLTGAPPYDADTMPELVYLVTQREPPPLESKRPGLPPGLVAAVHKCLRRDRAERFHDVAELATALVTFGPPRCDVSLERITRVLRGAGAAGVPAESSPRLEPATASAAERPPTGPSSAAAPTASTWAQSRSGTGARQRPALLAAAAAAGGVCILVLAGAAWHGLRASPADGLAGGRSADSKAAVDRAAGSQASGGAAAVPALAPSGATPPATPVTLAPAREEAPEAPPAPSPPGSAAVVPVAATAAPPPTGPSAARPRPKAHADAPAAVPPAAAPASTAGQGIHMGLKE
jgi:serine/threonine-protein kinase